MADQTKFVQAQEFTIAASGLSIGATSITLNSFKQIDGTTNLTMTDFGSIGYGTLSPNTSREEQISFTGVTQNVNGTATLTGVKTVLNVAPYTETSGVAKSQAGNAVFVISNTAGFYNKLVAKNNDETITGTYTFTSTAKPKYDTHPTFTADEEIIDKKYADDLAIAGAPDASTSTKGITKLSTAPASPTDPIAVGTNDPRVPTQGENDALAGSSGIPSNTNRYITQEDVSNAGASGKVVRLNGTSYPAADGSAITGIGNISMTASGNVLANRATYITANNTVAQIFPSNISSQVSTSTGITTKNNNKAFAYSNTRSIFFGGGFPSTAVALTVEAVTINTAETDITVSSNTAIDTNTSFDFDVCELSTGVYVVLYQYSNGSGAAAGIRARVVTYNGSTFTVGASSTIQTTGATTNKLSISPLDSSKCVILYPQDSTGHLKSMVLSISGTTITQNTEYNVFSTTSVGSNFTASCKIDTDKILVSYGYYSVPNYLYNTIVLSVSGTVISLGTANNWLTNGDNTNPITIYTLENNKAVLFKRLSGSSTNKWDAHIVTVSGTTPTVNSGTALGSTTTQGINPGLAYTVSAIKKYCIILTSNGTDNLTGGLFDFSSTTLSAVSSTNAINFTMAASSFLPGITKFAPFFYGIFGNTTKTLINLTNPSSISYLGYTPSSITDTNSGVITPPGRVVTTFSGLTAGTQYYLNDDGSLWTTPTTKSRIVGIAINSTTLLLQ